MKKDIHPAYGPVIFHDTSCDAKFLISSTFKSKETMKWEDGKEYPVCKLDTSSASHPIFTGKGRIEVSEGQVAKFRKRFGKAASPAKADTAKADTAKADTAKADASKSAESTEEVKADKTPTANQATKAETTKTDTKTDSPKDDDTKS